MIVAPAAIDRFALLEHAPDRGALCDDRDELKTAIAAWTVKGSSTP
jgi:hypothetical protein